MPDAQEVTSESVQPVKHHHHEIHFTVDGEPFETDQRELTPNQIILDLGHRDPKTNYLVQIDGHHRISYQGKGDEPIEIHNGMHFQIVSTGPTPVSDGSIHAGVELFVQGLRNLGYTPQSLPGKPDHVVIDYEVQSGRFAAMKVQQGFIVPADFPLTPPSGPHVSPLIHAFKTAGNHPTGAIHRDQAAPFQQALGGEWQYWSRPFQDWATSKRTLAAYMNHIWRLWDSQ
jgi:hypothetical protein